MLTLNACSRWNVTNNIIHDATSDLMRIPGSNYGLIGKQRIQGCSTPRKPASRRYSRVYVRRRTPLTTLLSGGTSYGMIPETGWKNASGENYMQGIFLTGHFSGPGYQNILIEQNLINIGSPNGIMIEGR